MGRFPKGMDLSREDLALTSWLYFYELETQCGAISEADLRWLIDQVGHHLELELPMLQLPQVVQRLMRFGVLRVAITDSRRQGYCLTRLGRSLARSLMEETDYSSEQLNVLFSYAFREVTAALREGNEALLQYLEHVLLGTIREKVEFKLLSIEEDLAERKREVRRTYSGGNETDFEGALRNIQYCRRALTELVDAVQESSSCVKLEELLHRRLGRRHTPQLDDTLEQSTHFLYVLRSRVDVMLKDVVLFIHDCVAFRSLAFTVDSRDRLRRIQERILTHALDHVVRMPVLEMPHLPRLDFRWSPQVRDRQVVLDMQRLKTLDDYAPPELPPVEPVWKEPFLQLAREEWSVLARRGGRDLGEWLNALARKMPQFYENPPLALWYLSQDWPQWTPRVTLIQREGEWAPLGDRWMMEAVSLVPVRSAEMS
jgi:hypothetical protein